MEEIVSVRVAKLLKKNFSYSHPTVYVYNSLGKKEYSLFTESGITSYPAPELIETVEYLWGCGIKIYYIPEGSECRGYVEIGKKKFKMDILSTSPIGSYKTCLEFLCFLYEHQRYLNSK